MEPLHQEKVNLQPPQFKLSTDGELEIKGKIDTHELAQLLDAAQYRASMTAKLNEINRSYQQILGATAGVLICFLLFILSFSVVLLIKNYVYQTIHQQHSYPR